MSIGDAVWAVIAGTWVIWTAVTAVVAGLPDLVDVVGAFLGSWAGRVLALAAWAGAGWHLFCQRP